jgi:hypothetical protein
MATPNGVKSELLLNVINLVIYTVTDNVVTGFRVKHWETQPALFEQILTFHFLGFILKPNYYLRFQVLKFIK